ncbi:2OG-Fe(II) oxygenase [Aurantiacibacter sp. MUD11]|uniref:2OG-Fe(II) oxygenase n=1 Tax=Aurantiacibacter sp. MUD11 TaxID=3003265 RepID=UPI0022AAF4B8|nr:2OG-Fe(II) oxygenase family protein [Aurantiacibacter sp. MUD11]WAT18023.1 2OG-Fe(II) oxygenase [Aurantiacibacter sp. MUD11]
MTQLDFSPALDSAAIARAAEGLSRDGYVRLTGVLHPDTAQALFKNMNEELAWSRVFNEGQRIWDIPPEKVGELEASDIFPQLHRGIMGAAQRGFQYQHDAVRVSDEAAERSERGWLVDQLLEALNSPEWLDVFRQVTADSKVALVDGQATRYMPGHFLTGHDDNVAGKNRVAAYVLGLTPQWRTEWGGQLLFHDADGDVERGLSPKFNVINLFTVPRMHSVAPVSEFAGAPRLSFTGWVRHAG